MILPTFLLICGALLGGVSIYLAVHALIDSLTSNKLEALNWSTGEEPRKSKSGIIRITRPLVRRLVLPLLVRYELKQYKEKIKREIHGAGIDKELNENEYVGLQVLLGLLLPAFVFTINFLFTLNYPFWFPIAFGILGYFFPYFYVKGNRDARRAQIRTDLPFVVDLLSLLSEAGTDFQGAIAKVTEKMPGGALAEELGQVLKDFKLGSSKAEALNAMAWRLNMSEISSFIAVRIHLCSPSLAR